MTKSKPETNVAASKRRLHGQLSRTEVARHANVQRLREIERLAVAHQRSLNRQLPALKAAADIAVGDERDTKQRDYLRAVQAHRNCEQVFQSARRERVIASNA